MIQQLIDQLTAPNVTTAQALFKLCVAMILGASIGYERKRKGQPAGLRTFSLIALGACLAMLVSIYVCQEYVGLKNGDPGRIAAQVISGIGFLGAGAIIQAKGSVRGLTTAAGIWMSSIIGLAVGVGLYILSAFATLLILFILVQLENIEKRLEMGAESRIIRLKVGGIITELQPYRNVLRRHHGSLVNTYVDYDYSNQTTRLNLVVLLREHTDYVILFRELSAPYPTESIAIANQLS
ncbi:MAG: MgtC/SapB family protein [Bacteroidales bacterium]|nr:MgtC/SapB family protein [Bacteroidales bacterium]